MNKIKTAELTRAALDWAVSKCEGLLRDGKTVSDYWQPSELWEQGGPIIERERIELEHDGAIWWARIKADDDFDGTTPLIAAMRCYVAMKLGDTVDIPAELLTSPKHAA